MNEENLTLKYVVLKINDINEKLTAIERVAFWAIVEKVIS